MNLIPIWLVIGGVLGWLASVVMKTDNQQGIILNVIVGITMGAFLGGCCSRRSSAPARSTRAISASARCSCRS